MNKVVLSITLFCAFSIVSNSQLKYNSSGYLGLGIDSPSSMLHIKPKESGKAMLLQCGNYDIDFVIGNTSTLYGYYWRYVGTGSGNLNNLELWTHGQSGTDVQVYEIHQDGNINFKRKVGIDGSSYDPLYFYTGGWFPSIQSDQLVQFTKTDNSTYIDVYCKDAVEQSDINSKENIVAIESSLEKVIRLNGVRYNWKNDTKRRINAGLIAQEVEEVIPEVVFTLDSTGKKFISYTKIIPYLIEAIKEQQIQINELIEEKLGLSPTQKMTTNISGFDESEYSSLSQNVPNPFSDQTVIKYYIPKIQFQAMINVYDLQGKQIKSYPTGITGHGEIVIPGSELDPGMYIYNLIVDNKEVASRRMILTQ